MGSRGSAGLGGATLRLTVVTTVTGGAGAIFVFLGGGCPVAGVVDNAVRLPFVDVVGLDADCALPPKKLIMLGRGACDYGVGQTLITARNSYAGGAWLLDLLPVELMRAV